MESKTFPEWEILDSLRNSLRHPAVDIKIILFVDQGIKELVWEGVFGPLRICPQLGFRTQQLVREYQYRK